MSSTASSTVTAADDRAAQLAKMNKLSDIAVSYVTPGELVSLKETMPDDVIAQTLARFQSNDAVVSSKAGSKSTRLTRGSRQAVPGSSKSSKENSSSACTLL